MNFNRRALLGAAASTPASGNSAMLRPMPNTGPAIYTSSSSTDSKANAVCNCDLPR